MWFRCILSPKAPFPPCLDLSSFEKREPVLESPWFDGYPPPPPLPQTFSKASAHSSSEPSGKHGAETCGLMMSMLHNTKVTAGAYSASILFRQRAQLCCRTVPSALRCLIWPPDGFRRGVRLGDRPGWFCQFLRSMGRSSCPPPVAQPFAGVGCGLLASSCLFKSSQRPGSCSQKSKQVACTGVNVRGGVVFQTRT